jgi:hypothetical protein
MMSLSFNARGFRAGVMKESWTNSNADFQGIQADERDIHQLLLYFYYIILPSSPHQY